MASGDIRIGISGWTYGRWRGVFYPEKLPRKRELGFAARCFPSIEIHGTFYRLLQPDSFARWRAETPPGFVFAVKGSRRSEAGRGGKGRASTGRSRWELVH